MTTCQSSNMVVLYRHGIYEGWVLVSCRIGKRCSLQFRLESNRAGDIR